MAPSGTEFRVCMEVRLVALVAVVVVASRVARVVEQGGVEGRPGVQVVAG